MAQPAPVAFPDSLAPSSPARSTAWVLRFVVALACAGMAVPLLMGHQSALHAYLTGVSNLPGATASLVDTAAAVVLLLVALAAVAYPMSPVVLLAALWPAAQLYAAANTNDSISMWDALLAAAPILAPLALVILCHWPGRYAITTWRRQTAITLLRLAIAGAFIAHGVRSFSLDQKYANCIASAVKFAIDTDLPGPTVNWLLRLVGTIDVAAAVALLAMSPAAKPRSIWFELAHRGIVGMVAALAVYQLESLREPAPFVAFLAAEGSHWLATPVTAGGIAMIVAALCGILASWLTFHWRVLTVGLAAWCFVIASGQFIEHGMGAPWHTLLALALMGLPVAMFMMWNDLLQVSAAADLAARKAAAAKAKAGAPARNQRPTEIAIALTPDRRPI